MKKNEEKGIRISVSVGEIFDKITILQIKQNKITDKEKLINVETELFEIRLMAGFQRTTKSSKHLRASSVSRETSSSNNPLKPPPEF